MWKLFWNCEKRTGPWKSLEVSWGSALLIWACFMPRQENRVVRHLGTQVRGHRTCLQAGATGMPAGFRTGTDHVQIGGA